MPDIHKSHIWTPDLLKSHKCIPGAHLFPFYKSFSFTPVYHIKQHIHCSFLQVWDYDRNKDDDFLGRCHLDLRFLSTDHNTSFLIIPSRIPKKFYVPVTIAMEKRTADGSDWTPCAENDKINVIDERYFGTHILGNNLPFQTSGIPKKNTQPLISIRGLAFNGLLRSSEKWKFQDTALESV